MSLPDSYTIKPNAIPDYFDALQNAQPPERFTMKFLENLGFESTNDRQFIGILKDLGLLNRDAAPQQRYFDFLDRSQAPRVLGEAIRQAFSDLFAVNMRANEMSLEDVKNKLRTLYAGKKTELVLGNIAKTFRALCDMADFSSAASIAPSAPDVAPQSQTAEPQTPGPQPPASASASSEPRHVASTLRFSGLQYHINIVLPETRDQSVYDAIFRSLREHLS